MIQYGRRSLLVRSEVLFASPMNQVGVEHTLVSEFAHVASTLVRAADGTAEGIL